MCVIVFVSTGVVQQNTSCAVTSKFEPQPQEQYKDIFIVIVTKITSRWKRPIKSWIIPLKNLFNFIDQGSYETLTSRSVRPIHLQGRKPKEIWAEGFAKLGNEQKWMRKKNPWWRCRSHISTFSGFCVLMSILTLTDIGTDGCGCGVLGPWGGVGPCHGGKELNCVFEVSLLCLWNPWIKVRTMGAFTLTVFGVVHSQWMGEQWERDIHV